MAADKALQQAKAGLHLVPEHMRPGALRYIEEGAQVGGFLTKLFNGDPYAFRHADASNREHVAGWMTFLTEHAPPNCWGTSQKRQLWQDQRGLQGW